MHDVMSCTIEDCVACEAAEDAAMEAHVARARARREAIEDFLGDDARPSDELGDDEEVR
jgi:hypothetical protein